MAQNIKTLPFPDFLLNTDYSLVLNEEGVTEDGAPKEKFETSGKCIFSEKAKRIIDADGKQITLLCKAIIKGDVAPSLKTVSDGTFTVNGNTYEIYAGYRPRNPDGTIHHTEFELKWM